MGPEPGDFGRHSWHRSWLQLPDAEALVDSVLSEEVLGAETDAS